MEAGAARRYTFGGADSMTAEEARAKARKILGDVAHGRDPSGERKAKRAELTVAELIDRYVENGCVVQRGKRRGQPMKPATKAFTLSRLRHHVLPLLGRKRVGDIRPAHIVQMAADIAAGKTRKDEKGGLRSRTIVRGGEGAARKVVRDLSAVFTYAQHNEIRADNPVENAPVNKQDNKRTRFLDLGEVRQLGAALVKMEARGLNPKAANIARLWALTGFRRNEAAGLKRSEIDWERSRATLGDTKTGVSIRPLGAPALALLSSIPPVLGSEYFFPASAAPASIKARNGSGQRLSSWRDSRARSRLTPSGIASARRPCRPAKASSSRAHCSAICQSLQRRYMLTLRRTPRGRSPIG